MDTNQYSNILNAINSQQTQAGLTPQQQADNYNAFSQMMKDGVYIPDVMKRIDELENKVKGLSEAPTSKVNEELFSVMEAAVKNDPDVKNARQTMADVKTRILTEMCMKDQRYREAYESYRTAVNASYIKQREHPTE